MPRRNINARTRNTGSIESCKQWAEYNNWLVQRDGLLKLLSVGHGPVEGPIRYRIRQLTDVHHCLFFKHDWSSLTWCSKLRNHFTMVLLLEDHTDLHRLNNEFSLPTLPEHAAEYVCNMLRVGKKYATRDVRRLIDILEDFLKAYNGMSPDDLSYPYDDRDRWRIEEVIERLSIQAEFLRQRGYFLTESINILDYIDICYSDDSSISAIDLSATM